MSEARSSPVLRLRKAWREARELVRPWRTKLLLGFFLMLGGRLAGLILPLSSKLLVDEVLVQHRADLLPRLALLAGAGVLISALASFALAQTLGLAAQRAVTGLRRELTDHLLHLPVRAFEEMRSGGVLSRVLVDPEGVRNLIGGGLLQLAGSLLSALLAGAVLFWLNWRLALAVLAPLGLFGGVAAMLLLRLRPLYRERNRLFGEVAGRLGESIGGIRVVKAYTAERSETRRVAAGLHDLHRVVTKAMTASAMLAALGTAVAGLTGVILLAGGGRAVLAGTMSLGDVVMFSVFTGLLAAPLVQAVSVGVQLAEAFAGLDRIRELRAQPTEREGEEQRVPVTALRGDIAFVGVSYAYREATPVVREISFIAPAGSTTALVGPSGSGKSTIVQLAMALIAPDSGAVLIDGRDLGSLRRREYRRQLGVVFQDNFLFDGTVAENIAFSRPKAPRAAVEEAGRVAHCDEFVRELPDGYDTVVGERGIKLSGGQRQRVAIARAILADPAILILDEATSSLDSESEALIQDGLRRLRTGRTTLVIAHRLSTIRSADQILVLEAGRIIERGRHDELLALGRRYRQLHDQQYDVQRDRFVNPGEDPVPASAVEVLSPETRFP